MPHKLTAAYDEALRQFAERLPLPEVKYRTPITGSQLLQDSPELRGPKGEPINPNRLYYVGSPTNATNHLRQLRKAYRRGGQPAVVAYLQPYEAFLGQPDTQAAQ
ncbi:MAG: hypothetical protein ACRYFK_14405 [Janthinobacterium lividum]